MWRPATELRNSLVFSFVAALLTACTAPVQGPQVTPVTSVPEIPDTRYHEARQQGLQVFKIDSRRSLITVSVYRDGPLARLGHDHVVASRNIEGLVRLAAVPPDPATSIPTDDVVQSRTDFRIPLLKLSVDEPELRAIFGLTTTPSEKAIAGTRRNMHEKVLQTDNWPWLTGHAVWLGGELAQSTLGLEINLHGVSWRTKIAAQINSTGDELRVKSQLILKQSDFGIEPFTALGGGLSVKDELDVSVDIIASAWRPDE